LKARTDADSTVSNSVESSQRTPGDKKV